MARDFQKILRKTQGGNLRRLREEREMTPLKLSTLLQCNVKQVYMMQSGKIGIGPDMMQRLCAVFNVGEMEFSKGLELSSPPPLFAEYIDEIKKRGNLPRATQLRLAADLEEVLSKYPKE